MKYRDIILLVAIIIFSDFSSAEDKDSSSISSKAAWKQSILGAKTMVLPGTPVKQLLELYGKPSFIDDKGDYFYRLKLSQLKGYDEKVKSQFLNSFVVFELDKKRLKKVRFLSWSEIFLTKKRDAQPSDSTKK